MTHRIDRSKIAGRLAAALLACTCLSPLPAWAVDFIVSNNADSGVGSLRQAIIDLNTTGGASNNIIVNSGVGTITLTSGDLQTVARNVTVVGNNNTLSGNNQFRGLFIGGFSGTTQTAVSASISNLSITNARAAGGTGGDRGGGGGAGLGGALFVAGQSSLTVSNVSLTGNAATGGAGGAISGVNGGGGGMGGAGGAGAGNAGGGGGGLGANGGNGQASGAAGIAAGGASGGAGENNPGTGGASGGGGGGGAGITQPNGGGGGVGGGNATSGAGGAGGFGGGGGSGDVNVGGAGGFGGGGGPGGTGGGGGFGGGGGGSATTAGAGGFGGGNGGAAGVGGGGGGAGLGGSVFVQQGGTLNVAGAFSVNGSSVTGGTGVGQGTAGSAFGSGMFLQGNGTVNFTPGSGVTQTISNVIADQTGSGGTGGNAGSYSLAKSGAGTLVLSAANTFTGGTTVTGGLVNFAAANNLGSGSVTLNGGGLQWATGTTTDISGQLAALGAGGGTFDTNGNNVSFGTALNGGALTKTGGGTLTLDGTLNAYTGATTISAGTLALANFADISSSSLVTVNGLGTFDISNNGPGPTAINALAGSGTVQLGGNGLFIAAASTEFSGAINGSGGLEIGSGTQTLSGVNGYTNATQIDQGATLALKGTGSIASSAVVTFAPVAAGAATLDISQTNSGATVGALFDILGVGAINLGSKTLTIANGGTFNGVIADGGIGGGAGGGLTVAGNELDLGGVNTYTGPTTIAGGAILALFSPGSIATSSGVNLIGAGATFDISGSGTGRTIKDLSGAAGSTVALGGFALTVGTANSTTFAGTIADGGLSGGTGGSLVKVGTGTLTLTGANTYTGGTTINAGLINFNSANNFGTGAITLAGGGLQWAAGTTTDISSRLVLGGTNATFDTNGNNVTFASALSGTGGITKAGTGILTLGATNTYAGGTTVTGGLINFSTAGNFGSGAITLNGGGLQWAAGSTTDISAKLAPLGAGGGTFDTNGNNVTLASAISGSGGLTKQGAGLLNLTGNNTFTGGTTVSAGTLAVNGSLASGVTVGPGATLGGNGTITGLVTNNGIIAPGNSIGTLNITGNFVQAAGGTYQVEVNNAGQGDRINATGTATLQGGTVQVLAQPGSYANSTTYTIVRATGGVSGTYAGVTSNFAFLTPTLSYDANDVFLTLALPTQNAFTPSFLALTPNQRAVGAALNQSFANASGDFATVIGALAGLNIAQGPLALDTISGQPYADFGTMNTNNSALFMNALGQQMANARGAASAGQRQALAQACEIAACDGVGPLSAWFSALGGLGSVLGDTNASTLTYNFGGAAAGIDYRLDPRFLVGIGVGYTHGTQWVNSFQGQGWSDSVSVAAYGSFTQGGLYVDALAGYAYFNNQLQRQILIPGLQQRTATGSTGANQFLGQIEAGYKIGVYAPAAATITPFGRFQISSVTQNAFSESGAQSLSLNVAQQTTNSQRTTIGADLGSSIGLGNERKLDLAVRLGWMHEFADVARPITAAFAGAPGNSFTVFGATPLRNAAVVGLQATTTIAAATQIYLRYDGEIATGTDNHALNIGLRMSW